MTNPGERVDVTSHARLRWLERVNAEEEHPAGAIRRALGRGVEFPLPALDAVVDEASDAILVYHEVDREATVVTVLDAAIERLDAGGGEVKA